MRRRTYCVKNQWEAGRARALGADAGGSHDELEGGERVKTSACEKSVAEDGVIPGTR